MSSDGGAGEDEEGEEEQSGSSWRQLCVLWELCLAVGQSCLSVGQKCPLWALLCSQDAALSILPLISWG